MKQDDKLMLAILQAIESSPDPWGCEMPVVEDRTREEVSEHVRLALEDGLLKGIDVTGMGDKAPTFTSIKLTSKGHKYLRSAALDLNTTPLVITTRIVVCVDICSSTRILEDLHQTGALGRWVALLGRVREELEFRREQLTQEIYKFIGDGWIIIIPSTVRGDDLFDYFEHISARTHDIYEREVKPYLQRLPDNFGVTFGMDSGALLDVALPSSEKEYVGRAINVACRLQGGIRDRDPRPADKVLVSRNCHAQIAQTLTRYRGGQVRRKLKNVINGEEIQLVKFDLSRAVSSD